MESIIKVIVAFLVAIIFGFIIAYPVMLLWNALMPIIFGLIKIDFWQALGIYILCAILFKANNN